MWVIQYTVCVFNIPIYSWKDFKSCKLFSAYFSRRSVNYFVLQCNKNGTTASQEIKSYKWATILYYLYYRISWKFIESYSSVNIRICNSRKFFIVILSSSYVPFRPYALTYALFIVSMNNPSGHPVYIPVCIYALFRFAHLTIGSNLPCIHKGHVVRTTFANVHWNLRSAKLLWQS